MPHELNTHRTNKTSDLETLRQIRDFLESGLTYDEIEPKLDIIEPTETDKELMTLSDFNQVLEQSRALIQKLQSQIDAQDQRIKNLENYLNLPFYKKTFTKPPKNYSVSSSSNFKKSIKFKSASSSKSLAVAKSLFST